MTPVSFWIVAAVELSNWMERYVVLCGTCCDRSASSKRVEVMGASRRVVKQRTREETNLA